MYVGMSNYMIERPLFCLEVFEIGQLAKVFAQMGQAEMDLEECQSQSLSLVGALYSIKRGDADIRPLELSEISVLF